MSPSLVAWSTADNTPSWEGLSLPYNTNYIEETQIFDFFSIPDTGPYLQQPFGHGPPAVGMATLDPSTSSSQKSPLSDLDLMTSIDSKKEVSILFSAYSDVN